jgi:AcrR family transcriptional regulator
MGLSRAGIVAAALRVIDRDGVDGLSMRRLGAGLGVDPKAVYYYLPNKAALFDGVVEALYAEMRLEDLPPASSWRDELVNFATRLRSVLRAHPRAVMVFATRPGRVEVLGAGAEQALRRLGAHGFEPRTALTVISCVRSLVVGLVIAEVIQPARLDPRGVDTDGDGDVSGQAASFADYPTLAEALANGFDADEQFHAGLDALLDGFTTAAA